MSKKSIAGSRPDDLIKPKTKDGKTELTELSEQGIGQVSGGSVDSKHKGLCRAQV
jgi:hypothetical protein